MRKPCGTRRNSKKSSLIKKPRGTRRILGKTPSKKKPPTIKKGRSKNIRTRKVLKGGSNEPNMGSVSTEPSFMDDCEDCILCYKKYGQDNEIVLGFKNYSKLTQDKLINIPENVICKYGKGIKDITKHKKIPRIFDTIFNNIITDTNGTLLIQEMPQAVPMAHAAPVALEAQVAKVSSATNVPLVHPDLLRNQALSVWRSF